MPVEICFYADDYSQPDSESGYNFCNLFWIPILPCIILTIYIPEPLTKILSLPSAAKPVSGVFPDAEKWRYLSVKS